MQAKKCDDCGEFYIPYDMDISIPSGKKSGSPMMYIHLTVDVRGSHRHNTNNNRTSTDLCGECVMKHAIKFIEELHRNFTNAQKQS